MIAELRSAEPKLNARAGKNSFPPTPFLFARLLNCQIYERGGYKKLKDINYNIAFFVDFFNLQI